MKQSANKIAAGTGAVLSGSGSPGFKPAANKETSPATSAILSRMAECNGE